MEESAVLDIPDISILEHTTAKDLVQEFQSTWGVVPRAVALPIVCPAGVPFDNDLIPPKGIRYGRPATETFLGEIVYEFASKGLDIFLTLTPTHLPFVRSELLHVIDISGDSSARICLGKSSTRRLLRRLMNDALERARKACLAAKEKKPTSGELVGVTLDLCDVFPLGANKERIELTCFCQECRDQLAKLSGRGRDLIRCFERFPNPWNLLLHDSGTGVTPIDDVDWDTDPRRIVELSHLKGFDEVLVKQGEDIVEQADVLHDYMVARHKQIVGAIQDLFDAKMLSQFRPQAHPLRRAIMVEGSPYDWTSGLFFGKLDDSSICEEIWTDPSASALMTRNVDLRSYMWRKCRYFIIEFFEFVASCQSEEKRTVTTLSKYSDEEIRALLERRRRDVMSASLRTKLDLFLLPELASDRARGRIGFVGAGFSENISRRVVESVRPVRAAGVSEEGDPR